ncbi:MAG TPA: kelch repeat-containing protein [Gemmataceae bacterium]|nr:kelch repeat-containing protein [Gemmataceae bacterium]
MTIPRFWLPFTTLLLLSVSAGAEPPANDWTRLEQGDIPGRRWDVPLGYAPGLNRFLVLGGRTSWDEYRKGPRPYDQLALDATEGRWENWLPRGKDWGPRFGPCKAPAWKDERFGLADAEGNARPNWTVYGTFSLGTKYDYDPDTRGFVFYAGGRTFRYDPAGRSWTDLAPKAHPEKDLGGMLLWGSMCYDRHNKRFVLFGGGNVQAERGDPGTWTYTPATNAWEQLKLHHQPPQRANSRLVYDPVAKKVLLFGGDALDHLLADTWAFDVVTNKWEERRPKLSPSPRAGHALLWLPKAKKVLLLGGYGYTSATGYVESLYRRLPFEIWTYDTATDTWELLSRCASEKECPRGPVNGFLPAAVGDIDVALVVGDGRTWMCKVAADRTDPEGTAKYGVKPGTTERRTGPHDPAWYREGVPPADADKTAKELKDSPPNTWAERPTPKRPRPNMDWGSAVFAPESDQIVRFSGGHSAYSGTAPQVYDVKADRWSIPFAPEYPIEHAYSNDQVHGEWSFRGNPWMTGHTYKATGYDPNLKALVFVPHEYTYFFDPKAGHWSRGPERNPYRPDFYTNTVCATPQGAVVWADRREKEGAGLWRLDGASRRWKALPLKGELPPKGPDHNGLAYDSKRQRLLFFSDLGGTKGDVVAYDLRTGEAKWLDSTGKGAAAVPSRETVYLVGADAVLVGAHVEVAGKPLWPLYDCAKNAWLGAELAGADPVGKGKFNNSMGLMYDPGRKLVWAVGQNGHVFVLRFDASQAKLHPLR